MVEDPPLPVPTYAIRKAWLPCLMPIHQLKVAFLESKHQYHYHFNSLHSENKVIQRIKIDKLNHGSAYHHSHQLP